jgi:high-affinity K+ transport system ATPase subunit B
MVVDAVSGVGSVLPGAAGDKLSDFAVLLEDPDNTPTFYAFVVGIALIIALIVTSVADLFAGGEKDEAADKKKKDSKKAAKAKKTDETEPDDEAEEEEADEEEEEEDEDEAPKTATRRRTKRG